MNPNISIIIPTYNSSKFLIECFDSVINQTYDDLEIIVVDGCSNDSTTKIIEEYCNKYNNWHAFTTHKGVSHQRNVGIEKAKGNYIFFLDSDDYISPNLINDLYKKLINEDLDLVTPSIFNALFEDNHLIDCTKIDNIIIPYVTINNFFSEGYNSFLAGPTKLYKKSLINDIRHDENLSYGEDLLFNYEIVKKQPLKYGIENDAIYYYRHYIEVNNIAKKRMNKSGYLFCNKMVNILKTIQNKENHKGAFDILRVNINLYLQAYVSSFKIIPIRLLKARIYMFKNTHRKIRYYYILPRFTTLLFKYILKKKIYL